MTADEIGSVLGKSNFNHLAMKTKSVLMLLALTGLNWGINGTAASSTVAPTSIDRYPALSHSISELVGLDRDTHSLLELAIERALIAQKVNGSEHELLLAGAPLPVPPPPAGGIPLPIDPPPTDKKPETDNKTTPPPPAGYILPVDPPKQQQIDSKTTNPKDLSIDRSKLKTVKKQQCKSSKLHK